MNRITKQQRAANKSIAIKLNIDWSNFGREKMSRPFCLLFAFLPSSSVTFSLNEGSSAVNVDWGFQFHQPIEK